MQARLLRIDGLNRYTRLGDVKLQLLAAALAIEREHPGGLCRIILVDAAMPYARHVETALTELGFETVRAMITPARTPRAPLPKSLLCKLENLTTLCGLTLARPAIFCFLTSADIETATRSAAQRRLCRVCDESATPLVFV